MGTLQRQRQLRGVRLHQDPPDPAAQGAGATIDVEGRTIAVGLQPALIEAAGSFIPLGRAGTPEEAANGVYLFCTPESDYISGQVIIVGGGATF